MDFLSFMGVALIGILLDRFVLMNPDLWGDVKKAERKSGNYYVK